MSALRTELQRARTFFDANVLVYADDANDARKHAIATELIPHHLRMRSGVVSTSSLGEYFYAATRKIKLDAAIARAQVETFCRFQVVEPTTADVLAAIDLHRLRRFSYWDSLMIRCALRAGCGVLLTEDLSHGQMIDGMQIVNPFL